MKNAGALRRTKGERKNMQIKYVKPMDLNPYKNNPRKNEKAVEPVMASIREFGFNIPITVDKDMVVITGHTRLKAAIRLGLEEVPVIILEDLNADQVKAFRLADNKTSEFAEWDFEALAIELKDIQMDLSEFDFEMAEAEAEIIEDDYEIKLPEEPKAKYGDIYKLGRHRLMCGDATKAEDLEKLMDMDLADCYLTDPPYNVNYGAKGELYETKGGYGTGFTDRKILNDHMEDSQFLAFLTDAFSAANSVLKQGGAFYIWHADSESYNFRRACKNAGWQVRQCLIWNKNALVLGRQDYQWKHEPCLYGWKDGAGHYFINDRSFTTVVEDGININKLKLSEAKELIKQLLDPKVPSTVINENKPVRSPEHPTMKPIKLIARIMKNSTRPGEIILDTFAGSGTTLMAAEQLNRKGYIMELDPKYVDVIIKRYEEFTGDTAEKIR